MTLEDQVTCPHCGKRVFVSEDVPNRAWYPEGAYFTWKEECSNCDEIINLSGRVSSEIEVE